MKRLFNAGLRIHAFYGLGFQGLQSREKETSWMLRLFADSHRLPASRLMLPSRELEAYSSEVIDRLRKFHGITHLALSLFGDRTKAATVKNIQPALAPVYKMIAGMESLQVLWLQQIFPWMEDGNDACYPILKDIAELCPSLKLVQLYHAIWRIHHNQGGHGEPSWFEELDIAEREREVSGFFDMNDASNSMG